MLRTNIEPNRSPSHAKSLKRFNYNWPLVTKWLQTCYKPRNYHKISEAKEEHKKSCAYRAAHLLVEKPWWCGPRRSARPKAHGKRVQRAAPMSSIPNMAPDHAIDCPAKPKQEGMQMHFITVHKCSTISANSTQNP